MLRRHSEIYRGRCCCSATSCWSPRAGSVPTGSASTSGFPRRSACRRLEPYLVALGLLVPVWALGVSQRGLYAPRRTDSRSPNSAPCSPAATTVVVLLVVATFFARSYFFSRGVILLFWMLSIDLGLARSAVVARELLVALHRRGRNLSSVLVVGAGPLAEQVIDRVHAASRGGSARGRRARGNDARMPRVRGVPVLGRLRALRKRASRCAARRRSCSRCRARTAHRLEALLDELDGRAGRRASGAGPAARRDAAQQRRGLRRAAGDQPARHARCSAGPRSRSALFDIGVSALGLLARRRRCWRSLAARGPRHQRQPPSSTCRSAWASTGASSAW